jgi:hypothetical protein
MLDPLNLTAKISALIDYLTSAQREDGSFRTLQRFHFEAVMTGPQTEFKGWYESEGSLWASSVILYHLSNLKDARLAEMKNRGCNYLETTIEHGLARFIPSNKNRIFLTDADDTALVYAALRRNGREATCNETIFLANQNDEGSFYTWFVPRFKHLKRPGTFIWLTNDYLKTLFGYVRYFGNFKWRLKSLMNNFLWVITTLITIFKEFQFALEPAVNANALLYFGVTEDTRRCLNTMIDQVKSGNFSVQYYPDRLSVYFQIARLHQSGLQEIGQLRGQITAYIQEQAKNLIETDQALDIALGCLGLMYFDDWENPLLTEMIDYLADHSMHASVWQPFSGCNNIGNTVNFGAPELTAFFFLEALSRYVDHHKKPTG